MGIIFGLITLITGGISNALVRVPSKLLGASKLIFYRNALNTVLLFIILLFTFDQATFSLKYILLALLLSIVGYVPMYFFCRAMAIGKVGVVSPVASTNTLIAALLAFLIFNERLSGLQLFSIAIIVTGIILISINFKEFKKSNLLEISSGIPFALIAAIGWGIWMVLIKFPVSELGPYLTSFIIEGGALVIAFLTLKRSNEELKVSDKKVFLYIIPISILMTIWSISYYQGIKISDISVIVAISSASPFVVTLFGKIFYKEELAFKQYLAIALIISGIILISLK